MFRVVNDNIGFISSRRPRCISCSDSGVGSSFEDSSLHLDNTLLPRRSRTSSISERIKVNTKQEYSQQYYEVANVHVLCP